MIRKKFFRPGNWYILIDATGSAYKIRAYTAEDAKIMGQLKIPFVIKEIRLPISKECLDLIDVNDCFNRIE